MLDAKRRPPRAPEDHRMNLYHDTFRGRLRWYVKVSNTGRRIDIAEEYSMDERSDFHRAWEAAVRALGGVPRMRRTRPDEVPTTTRRYLISDVSDKGQLRWYVQLRDKLPKIRIYERFGSDKFDRAIDAAIVDQIGKFGDARSANHCRTHRPFRAACVGIGRSTNRAIAGLAMRRSVKKGWPKARETRGPD
jgi:plasmid stabilization system protein ParE